MGIYIMQSRTILACWRESSPYEFNYVVHMDDYIHLPRRQKKRWPRLSTLPSKLTGFLHQGQSHIAHRWEHLLRRRTLCCAYKFDANPGPTSKQPRVSLHWENPTFRKRRTTNALASGEDEIRTLEHRSKLEPPPRVERGRADYKSAILPLQL